MGHCRQIPNQRSLGRDGRIGCAVRQDKFSECLRIAVCRGSLRVIEIRRDQPTRERQEEAEVQSIEKFKSSNRAVGYCQNIMFSSCTMRARSALE